MNIIYWATSVTFLFGSLLSLFLLGWAWAINESWAFVVTYTLLFLAICACYFGASLFFLDLAINYG